MKKDGRLDLLVLIGLCLSAAVNVYLARQLFHQRALASVLRPPTTLNVGAVLATSSAVDIDHRTITVDPRSKNGTLIYVFSPTCHFCEQNRANLLVIARLAATRGYRVLGISMVSEGLPAYLTSNPLPFTVLVANAATRRDYHLSPTPETFVVGADGTLVKHWLGAWRDDTATAIEAFFGCHLPGLTTGHP